MDRSNEPAMQELTKTADQSGYSLYDLLNSMGYCGFKLWSQEDMEAQFAVMMREVKDDNSRKSVQQKPISETCKGGNSYADITR